ncbi:UDP-galactose transporter senju [Leptopilina boulardi]|uniref:UDP-galactose transporter senju n=1 Tax=Leptopilina boulardi TaxID=63433 RepID=UPI0021F69112|nr:UDP-galactose transporter senju [Leptopilina boulardi]
MTSINWREIFPGKWSIIIFILYMALFVNQGILVTWSQHDKEYNYNTVLVVLMTEVLKLIISTLLYLKDNQLSSLLSEISKNRKVLVLYMVPSSLYCLYNNLTFLNLAKFDPTTYFLLLQFRVVITGLIFQVVFKKKLSVKQWVSLIILTIGCMVKHLNLNFNKSALETSFTLNIDVILIFVQTICSCLAGVYNEYLLKGEGANVDMFLQNMFMYFDSILCNVAFLVLQGDFKHVFDNAGSSIFFEPKVILIMFNNAGIGIVTSFFLKNLNSIVKSFASALELVFTAILCWLLFNIPIYLNTILAIAIVSYAIILYSQNPIQNVKTRLHENLNEEQCNLKDNVV